MTAPRKKWRIKRMAASITYRSCESKPAAYRLVEEYRRSPGLLSELQVQVSEDGGKTWQIFEQLLRSRGDF